MAERRGARDAAHPCKPAGSGGGAGGRRRGVWALGGGGAAAPASASIPARLDAVDGVGLQVFQVFGELGQRAGGQLVLHGRRERC